MFSFGYSLGILGLSQRSYHIFGLNIHTQKIDKIKIYWTKKKLYNKFKASNSI